MIGQRPKLFVTENNHGFFSVDPFRLYPGSPIDEERPRWEANTGMKVHRYPWWHDGDQDFLSEWVDPSPEHDFRRALSLRHELFAPIAGSIRDAFDYRGPARGYYLLAVGEQVDLLRPQRLLHTLSMWHLWRGLTGGVPEAERRSLLGGDDELALAARRARAESLRGLEPAASGAIADALLDVPRERFVDVEYAAASAQDRALPLSDDGGSTISARTPTCWRSPPWSCRAAIRSSISAPAVAMARLWRPPWSGSLAAYTAQDLDDIPGSPQRREQLRSVHILGDKVVQVRHRDGSGWLDIHEQPSQQLSARQRCVVVQKPGQQPRVLAQVALLGPAQGRPPSAAGGSERSPFDIYFSGSCSPGSVRAPREAESPMISITHLAADKVKEIAQAEGLDGQGLRLRVIGGGCAGFQYDLYFEDSPTELDEQFESNGVQLFIDPLSYQYLDGTEIDYVEGVHGAGFKFGNPNVSGTCGCGSSFQI